MGHPGRVAAGVTAIGQAWSALIAGVSLEDYALEHQELAMAMEKFGGMKAERQG